MSTESSSTKWIVGCLIAGVFGVFLLCGGVLVVVYMGANAFRQVAQQVGPQMRQQMQDMQFATAWQAPAADAGPDVLFPEQVSGWLLDGHDEFTAIPELAIARDGLQGTYESSGVSIDVYACQISLESQATQFAETAKAIDDAGYTMHTQANVDVGSYHWMTFSFSPPERYGRMWWAQDWLIVTMTENADIDLESFERDYLTAVSDAAFRAAVDVPADAAPDLEAAPDEPAPTEPAVEETAPTDPDAAPDDPEAAPAEPTVDESVTGAPAGDSPRG